MTTEVAGTTERKTWVLGWGDQTKVLEPAGLRGEVAAEVERVGRRYREGRR